MFMRRMDIVWYWVDEALRELGVGPWKFRVGDLLERDRSCPIVLLLAMVGYCKLKVGSIAPRQDSPP